MSFFLPKPRLLAASASLFIAANGFSQDFEVVNQPSDQLFDNKTASFSLDLAPFLALPNVDGQMVILETSQGNITFELLSSVAPATVTNFLAYVDDQSYDDSVFHRSVPGFIVQAGGFASTIPPEEITTKGNVENEFNLSNTRGTVAMAKLGGDPDSATSQWFINLADNSENLDAQNGGFTVFARVIGGGMDVADAIAALQRYNFGGAFSEMPIERILDSEVTVEDFVNVFRAYRADFLPSSGNDDAFIHFPEVNSSDSTLVDPAQATFDGTVLTLELENDVVGTTDISIIVEDPNGMQATLSFTIELEQAYVTLDPLIREQDHNAGSYTITVDSNTVWQAATNSNWIQLSTDGGDGDGSVGITLSANESGQPRFGQVTIGDQIHRIYQDGDYDSWISEYFTSEQIAAMAPDAYLADSDGDGLSNRFENILGLDPADSNSRVESTLSLDEKVLSFSHKPFPEGLELTLETSEDLSTWTTTAIEPSFTEANSPQERWVHFVIQLDSDAFFRLQVDSPFLGQD